MGIQTQGSLTANPLLVPLPRWSDAWEDRLTVNRWFWNYAADQGWERLGWPVGLGMSGA